MLSTSRTVKPVNIAALLAINLIMACVSGTADYIQQRNKVLHDELRGYMGGNLDLASKEKEVSAILVKEKLKELESGYGNSASFLPLMDFFRAKPLIDKSSAVFRIIRKLPKGASLHTHFLAAVSADFIINNLTYRENIYGGFIDDVFKLKLMTNSKLDDRCEWVPLTKYREEQGEEHFNQFLKSQLTLNGPRAETPELVWKRFKKIFSTLFDFVCNKQIFEDFIYQILQELHDDNIMYTEIKGTIMPLEDMDGRKYTKQQYFEIFIAAVKKFKFDHPDFIGVGYIHSIYRGLDEEAFQSNLEDILKLKNQFPGFIIGIDFVGCEEEGKPLIDFHRQLLKVEGQLKFFFHAGETNWFGHTDTNLADAILLNSSRLGHGFALLKHPILLERARQQQISIEICPLSNQILQLNADPRNHPATFFIATNYPIVVCNDDPLAWDATGLSYDWYVTFLAMTSKTSGLEVLKQLAINSIKFSVMEETEKTAAMAQWQAAWNNFLDDILRMYKK